MGRHERAATPGGGAAAVAGSVGPHESHADLISSGPQTGGYTLTLTLNGATPAAGLYTVRIYLSCSTAGNTLNATAALNWTDGVGSKSIAAFAAVECNATTNAASNTATLYSDGAAVTVVVAYSGTGAWYAYAQLIG